MSCHDRTRSAPVAHLGSPADVVARWPTQRPLVALVSAPTAPNTPWARWSIIAAPVAIEHHPALQGGPLQPAQPHTPHDDTVPFVGGWIGALAYELGRVIEPAVCTKDAPERSDFPPGAVVRWFRCPAAYVHDAHQDRWWAVGTQEERATLPGLMPHAERARWGLGRFRSRVGRDRFEHGVGRVIELIRDGDVFQTNLTHPLEAPFYGSARAWFTTLLAQAGPWYGAYIEDGADTILSASPELFLHLDSASETVTTRPIKGTCRVAEGIERLERSEKDRAELAMIVDLMRNDIGRVCSIGSVSVDTPREIERHGCGPDAPSDAGVYHGVATVTGRRRPGVTVAELLGATFPGGSITGAPKIRAMQIIESLERGARGVYTGSIGYVSDCGNATFNIAIRTATIRGDSAGPGQYDLARATVGVGAGIVVDSEPSCEWRETMHKAEALARSVGTLPEEVST